MAFTLVTNQTIIARNAGALYNVQVGTANMASYASTAGTNPAAFLNSVYAQSVGSTAPEAVAAELIKNLGITGDAAIKEATDYIVGQLNPVAVSGRGAVVNDILNLFSGLTGDTWGPLAAAWNTKVANAVTYATVTGNTDTTFIAISEGGNTNEASKNFVLTTVQDLYTGGNGADNFRGVAGAAIGAQDQTTLNSSDIIDGGAGDDTLIVNMTGPAYNGGARIKNIETLQIGSNQPGAATFDYNVNQGSNEITEVTKIVYDQINIGETLTVQNILATNNQIPTLAWTNEAGSTAGRAIANFRESAVSGATNVNVELNNVKALTTDATTGVLNIGSGVETLTITSGGTTANTLNNSNNVDGVAADVVSGSNDGVNDNGALTKVILKGAQALGAAPGVVTEDATGEASYGLTNRAANGANDLGISNTRTSASNLLSVAGTVTTVDATAADGGVAVRFVGNANPVVPVNVTFDGGKGNDYVEFQLGNVKATGGEGNDTFAFVNGTLTNYDFGSADSITGGAGTDTIQLGLNGAGVITANTTEFNNKSGIDVLDLRGAVNTVTLADAFVSGADAGFIVRTDKIVQTSSSNTANTTPSLATNNNALENAAVSTVVLTQLADNRAVQFIGGSGSDRLVVNNATANQFSQLDGGTNAAVGSFDSLTVVNTAVLDANDVANIKAFELLNLVESSIANNTFNVSISEAFLKANTSNASTLTIASVTNTYGTRLGAGDVVNLEISDLLVGGVAKPTIAGLVVNVQDLIAAGVTVNFQQNGVTVSTNAAPAALAANVNIATAPAATLLDDVPGAVAPVVIAPVNATLTAAVVTANATVTTGGAGTADTLTISTAGTVTIGSNTTLFENLVLANDTNTVTLANGFTGITGGTGADTINMTVAQANAITAMALGAGADTVAISDAGTTTFVAADLSGVDTITLTGASTLNVTPAAALAVTTGAAATTVTGNTTDQTITINAAAVPDGTLLTTSGTSNITVTGLVGDLANTASGINSVTLATAATHTLTSSTAISVNAAADADNNVITIAGAGAFTVTGASADVTQAAGFTGDSSITTAAVAAITVTTVTGAGNTVVDATALTDGQVLTLAGADSATVTLLLGDLTSTTTGNVNVSSTQASVGTNVIVTGAGNDTIAAGGGADTITTGTGNDQVSLAETVAAVDTLNFAEYGAANVDTVTGFAVNQDLIAITAGNIVNAGGSTYTLSSGDGTDVAAGGATTVVTVAANAGAAAADASAVATETAVKATSVASTSFFTALGTSTVTVAGQTAGEAVEFVWYDVTNSQAVFGVVDATTDGTATSISQNDTFVEIVRVGMTAGDYALLAAGSFGVTF